MRVLGFALLTIGFGWSCVSASFWHATISAATSNTMSLMGQRETFQRQDVFDLLYAQRSELRRQIPLIVAPGLLMFCGGILLSRRPPSPPASHDNAA